MKTKKGSLKTEVNKVERSSYKIHKSFCCVNNSLHSVLWSGRCCEEYLNDIKEVNIPNQLDI